MSGKTSGWYDVEVDALVGEFDGRRTLHFDNTQCPCYTLVESVAVIKTVARCLDGHFICYQLQGQQYQTEAEAACPML